jgi:glycosyltransferase involved in cell wall biosynthesis
LPALAFGLQSLTFAAAAAAYVRKLAPPAVYSRDWPVLAAVAGVGAFVGRRGGGPWPLFWEAHDLPQGRVARLALRRLLPLLRGVIPISDGLREELSALGLPPDALLVAPDAVDLDRFASLPTRSAARGALGLPLEARIVVYTGHLYRWKGAHTLALASRHLPPDVTVYVVGGTPADVTAFRAFVAEEALENVRVVGYVPPVEVPVWLVAADALALPNSAAEAISARYTSPLKLFEYMAAGRPIVASDLPSLKEVLADGVNARLVRPDDPVALAAGLAAVLADPAAGAALAEQATRDVAGRTWHARAAAVRDFVDRRRRPAEAPTSRRASAAPALQPAPTLQPAPPSRPGR